MNDSAPCRAMRVPRPLDGALGILGAVSRRERASVTRPSSGFAPRVRVAGISLAVSLVAGAAGCPRSTAADEAAVALPPMLDSAYDYPVNARRLNQQGRFLVELSVDAAGRATDVALLAAEPTGVFDRSLLANLRHLRFNVPRDWQSSGHSARRFRVNVIFLIRPCRETGPCVELPPLTAGPIVTFTGAPTGP